jgi:hypothetical protein
MGSCKRHGGREDGEELRVSNDGIRTAAASDPEHEAGTMTSGIVVAPRCIKCHDIGLRRNGLALTAVDVPLEVRGTIVMANTSDLLRRVPVGNETRPSSNDEETYDRQTN